MVAYYEERPSVFSKTNTQITYRWDIVEEINEENERSSYKCNEVTFYLPVSREKLTQEVINALWSNDDEKKLINDYNSAMILGDVESKDVLRYKEFLIERNRVKEQIKEVDKQLKQAGQAMNPSMMGMMGAKGFRPGGKRRQPKIR